MIDATDLLAGDFFKRMWEQEGVVAEESTRELLANYLAVKKWVRHVASKKEKADAQGTLDHYQYKIDRLLERLLAGDDARTVFKLDKKTKGRPRNGIRDLAIALEAARFQNPDGTLDANAAGQIADKFKVESITVQRKHKKARVTPAELSAYIVKLKHADRL